MKALIKHEIPGRIRVHLIATNERDADADKLQYYLGGIPGVTKVKIYERNFDCAIEYTAAREEIIAALCAYNPQDIEVPEDALVSMGRADAALYREKVTMHVVKRLAVRWLLPAPIRYVYTVFQSVRFVSRGLKLAAARRIEVPVLDAVAIGVSLLRRDFNTAGSVMFLLGIGDILEEWAHKKSVADLARSMSLNVGKVWVQDGDHQVEMDYEEVKQGDLVVVRTGNQIPYDGKVRSGDAMVNQSSMTGESLPVRKSEGGYVYAGTVIEEGEITIEVTEASGATRYENIVTMIEESEKLKSSVENKASHLADKLVPYTLLGTIATYLITGNVTKAMSVLMVDFSCALKLAMPITVLSAMREARDNKITVKGGKFMEDMAEAEVIVFDKTGTLTKAKPKVHDIVTFGSHSKDEVLRVAACLEEHFPHSMAKAVVKAAAEKNLEHEEMHSKVEYIVAHGIVSKIGEKRVIIGSHHFVFEDEKIHVPDELKSRFNELPDRFSHLFMAVDGSLEAVILVDDPLRDEVKEVISGLRNKGFKKIVMMTGDSERTARAIADELDLDEYYAEVLPEDKAGFIEKEKEAGRKVIMIGDGINDSPALSAAHVGVAISDGAAIAREIADVTIAADDLRELIKLRELSELMMKRIGGNYGKIMGINGTLIGLGVLGIIQPTVSAVIHNSSTLLISLASTRPLLTDGSPA